jgi:hypothetical protein
MPTPDDATVSPVEHESIAGRATCPPEEARITSAHEPNEAHGSSASNNVESIMEAPMQQPTPPPQEPSTQAQSPSEDHTKTSNTIEAPNRDIPTPMTTTDDGSEEQRTSQASPLSANAPAPVSALASHLASPFPAYRVRPYIVLRRHA